MAKDGKKHLTTPAESAMILTDNEQRIMANLRRAAAYWQYGRIHCEFVIHEGKLTYGNARMLDPEPRL